MVTYQYTVIEPKTGVPVLELPLYGTHMDKVLNRPGNFTGTYRLKTGVFFDDQLLRYTLPGRYGIVCRRNNVPIWGGMLWSRTYSSEANTIQLTGQTFESVFSHIALVTDFIKNTPGSSMRDWYELWQDIIGVAQTQSSAAYNFGMTLTGGVAGTDGPEIRYAADGYTFFADILRYFSEVYEGYSYSINLTSAGDTISKVISLTDNETPASSGMHFDFPGTVTKFWLNENASRAGVRHVARASGVTVGSATPAVVEDNADLISDGFVPWHNVQNLSNVQNITELTTQADRIAEKFKMPVAGPTFELGDNSYFEGWNDLGKLFKVTAFDARFPSGKTFESRLDGWSLTPESSGSEEVIRLSLDGDS